MSNDITTYSVMNPTFQMVEERIDDKQAIVTIEPLESGYGHTLGNALRRVLLTSLPGHAVSKIRVEGVDHLYSTVKGMTEDVLELSLNVKQIKVKSSSNDQGVLRLEVAGPKNVTAGDISASAGLEILNPELHLATLAPKAKLEMEMTVEAGLGYEVADEKKAEAIGDIIVDALYSPIVKVTYEVEQTRVGRRTDFDKVILNITTDGSIEPMEAVRQASRILAKQFAQVFDPVIIEEEAPQEELSPEEAEVLRLTVEELDLPTRIANALRRGGYKTVGDLVKANRDVVAKVKNLGEKSVEVVDSALEKKGVSFKK